MCKYFYLQVWYGGSVNICETSAFSFWVFFFFFALNLNSGRRHDIGSHSSVSHDEQKKMSHDVVHSSATHADLLRDVTDTDC